jgi:hypothetical protein
MKKTIILFCILVSSNCFATDKNLQPVVSAQKPETKVVQTRCRFSDVSCSRRPESKATRALKRLNRF